MKGKISKRVELYRTRRKVTLLCYGVRHTGCQAVGPILRDIRVEGRIPDLTADSRGRCLLNCRMASQGQRSQGLTGLKLPPANTHNDSDLPSLPHSVFMRGENVPFERFIHLEAMRHVMVLSDRDQAACPIPGFNF